MHSRSLHNRFSNLFSLLLFDSDGGAGSGGGAPAGGSGEGAGPAGGDPAGAGDSGEGGKSGDEGKSKGDGSQVSMTQEQFDALIDKRIGAARAGWEKDLGSYAEAENETAQQKAEREAQEARQQAVQATETANTTLRRAEATIQAGIAGIKPERISAALAIAATVPSYGEVEVKDDQVDAAAMAKVMEKIAADYPEFKNQGVHAPGSNGAPGGSTGGTGDNGGEPPAEKPKTMEQAVAARLAAATGTK